MVFSSDPKLGIESLLQVGDSASYLFALIKMYGEKALRQAEALLNNEECFFCQLALGSDQEHCDMHQRLHTSYRKIWT